MYMCTHFMLAAMLEQLSVCVCVCACVCTNTTQIEVWYHTNTNSKLDTLNMDDTLDTRQCHTHTYMYHAHIHLYTYTLTRHHFCFDKLCSSPQLSTNSYMHSPTTQTHDMDEVHLGRRGREADLADSK